LSAAVPETPAAPPRDLRPGRLAQKQRAGASRAQLTALLGEAGLTETAAADPASLPDPPASWHERTAAVEHELRRRFGNAPALATALEQSSRIGQLLHSGELVSQVIRLRRLG
jgi:hypothetical protein